MFVSILVFHTNVHILHLNCLEILKHYDEKVFAPKSVLNHVKPMPVLKQSNQLTDLLTRRPSMSSLNHHDTSHMCVCIHHEYNIFFALFSPHQTHTLPVCPISHICQTLLYQDILFCHLFFPRPQVHTGCSFWVQCQLKLCCLYIPLFISLICSYSLISAECVLTVSHKQWMSTACRLSQRIPGGLTAPSARR